MFTGQFLYLPKDWGGSLDSFFIYPRTGEVHWAVSLSTQGLGRFTGQFLYLPKDWGGSLGSFFIYPRTGEVHWAVSPVLG
jgi:hypothetical protein